VIRFLVTAAHDYTIDAFLDAWGRPLRDHVRVWQYEARPWRRGLLPGAYVFCDLERLTAGEREEAGALHDRIAASGPGHRALNDPRRTMRRFELLEALADRGINGFRAHRLAGPPRPLRFPVFLRAASSHGGSLTGLLRSPEEVAAAAESVGAPREDVLVVEYCDASAGDGRHVKHAAMRIGDAIFPRHVLHDRHWVVKNPVLVDERSVREEEEYCARFPHRAELQAVFDLAGVEYGRIDYAVPGGRLQVFEINTNPVLVPPRERIDPRRLPAQERSAALAMEALRALAGEPRRMGALRRRIDAALRRARGKRHPRP
jgi:hypothetical protein